MRVSKYFWEKFYVIKFYCFFFFPGLEQVLEFMYTAKLTLNPQNIEDVIAVATFLQMQEIVNACSAFQSLTVPASSKPG